MFTTMDGEIGKSIWIGGDGIKRHMLVRLIEAIQLYLAKKG